MTRICLFCLSVIVYVSCVVDVFNVCPVLFPNFSLYIVCAARTVYRVITKCGARWLLWGTVSQWLERATDNRVVAGSNPAEAVWKLWQFPLPHFASVFRKRH